MSTSPTSRIMMALLIALAILAGTARSQITNVDNEVDYDVCYESLRQFDGADRRMYDNEYLQFIQDFGGRTECLGSLQELPLRFRLGFNQLSCECLVRGEGVDCCKGTDAHIPTTGVEDGEPFRLEEQNYLRQVCLRTDQLVIAFCGPPPPPVIPPPPPFNPVTRAVDNSSPDNNNAVIGSIIGAILLCFLLCCCRRRRWCLCAGKKYESESSSSSSSSSSEASTVVGHEKSAVEVDLPITEFVEEEIEKREALAAVPAPVQEVEEEILLPDVNRTKNIMEEEIDEDDQDMGTWNRQIEDPEYEDIEDPRRLGGYEQLEPPPQPEEDMKLKHVEKPPLPPPEEDPHEIEHYVPDGGVVEYERDWKGGYEADGGYQPEIEAEKEPMEPYRYKYDRDVKEEAEPVDNRKLRKIEGYGGGEVWNQLEQGDEPPEPAAQGGDMFDWVIRSTLNTLDQKGDELKGSRHSKDSKSGSSKDSKEKRDKRDGRY
mmetsp:Transcript_17336/g.48860  ORF Transcript_17336/g.48860 Transcript_17336/m.48860 type:complete len:486 (-) Transcript_17336:1297-2754(-)